MISADTIKTDVWNTFRTLIVNNVTSVLIKGSGGANTKTVTIHNYSQSFPDKVFDDKDSYPMIVIHSPEFSTSPVTFRNREFTGRIEFEIFTTQSESADKISDLINKVIMDNESNLGAVGIYELELDSTDSNHYDRNKIEVHSRMVVWRYKITW
jgi:hypothetical protein